MHGIKMIVDRKFRPMKIKFPISKFIIFKGMYFFPESSELRISVKHGHQRVVQITL